MQTRPSICCLEVDSEVVENLKESFTDVFEGSLGKQVICKIPSIWKYRLMPNYIFPKNLQEYDFLVVDLCANNQTSYYPEEHTRETVKTLDQNAHFILNHPKTIFDPRPFSLFLLASRMKENNAIYVIFCDKKEIIDYSFDNSNDIRLSNYVFTIFDNIIVTQYGKKFIKAPDSKVAHILEKYISDTEYNVYFNLSNSPYSSISASQVTPLLINGENKIISFFYGASQHKFFFFPDIKDKKSFLVDFFKEIAPLYVPEYFPDLTEKKWLNDNRYFLPNHTTLLRQSELLIKEYEEKQKKLEIKILDNDNQYKFLHDLISETGHQLVEAVKKFLQYIDFINVQLSDKIKTEGVPEEDLTIDNPGEPILLIEIKGINGTSKDSDCSQILKVVNRRKREKKRFDIHGLYIVNHQRNLPPIIRQNPPFTDHQKNDAVTDERGLLTTWQLFNLYYDIEKGLISKQEVRQQLFQLGPIEFKYDNLIELGVVKEIFEKGLIGILSINKRIEKNSFLYYKKDDKFCRLKISSIQVNDKNVEDAENKEVGIKWNEKIKVGEKIYIHFP